jgi:hypothetical protein
MAPLLKRGHFFCFHSDNGRKEAIVNKKEDGVLSKEIKKKMVAISKEMKLKTDKIYSSKQELYSLEEEYSALKKELAVLDVPVVSVSLYHDDRDEFKLTGSFDADDALDKRLDLNTSWDNGKRASLYAGIEGLHCAEYSMDENPLAKVCSGETIFTYPSNSDSGRYESKKINSPNNAQALIFFFRAMHFVGDTHHCYLEGYEIKKENGINIVEFSSGS